ncbi:MAG TPA: OmpA family protein, partial [Polyangiaceae bacterium LLY-WYZ-15_(1-7)]|nr:OmpA family protein [Polyangiaceae bacterium LLY-WYZ-15_(1-7)]
MRALTLAFAALVLVLGVAFTGEARAQVPTHTVRAELGLSFTLSDPHRDLYGLGGGGGLGYEYRLHDYVGLEGHFGAYFFASDADAVDFGSVYALSVGARIHPLPELELVDLYGSVRAAFAITGEEPRPGLEIDLGAEFRITDAIRVGPFVRYAHVFQPNGDNLGPHDGQYLVIGVTGAMAFGMEEEPPPDTDGDGILDEADGCPSEPEDVDEFEDADGCPDPDNDGDGVLDEADACAMEAEDADGYQDGDGCPDPDNDRDGIADEADECPDEAEDMDGDRDEDGCPEEPADADSDGVIDAEDQCVNEPEDRDRFEDEDGCPDPDNDQDGVPDETDECPTAPGEAEANGCPVAVRVEEGRIQILQRIQFRTNSARLRRSAAPILVEVASVLAANPQIRKVRVEGHTDNRASRERNQVLSEERAQAVLEWLVERGIERERLER